MNAADPRVSVVLCTLGRSTGLGRAITSVLEQQGVDFELVLVDNAPETGDALRVAAPLASARLRYVAEPRRGLSVARNCGSSAARGEVVVFTDDDCVAAPGWLLAIQNVLELHSDIGCVTGQTVPDGPTTPIQRLFEEFGSFNRGPERRVWRYAAAAPVGADPLLDVGPAGDLTPIFPYSAVFGSGNNMAFRRTALELVGPFDEALGAGSPAGGGEDLDMFIRVVLAGLVVVYEPAALIRHTHRQDELALAQQVRTYGSGLSAMLTKHALIDTASRLRLVRRALPGLRHLLSSGSTKNARKSATFPRRLTRIELLGVAQGPWLYLRGRRSAAAHREHRTRPGWTLSTAPTSRTLVPELLPRPHPDLAAGEQIEARR